MNKMPTKGVCDNSGRTHFSVGHVPWNKGKKVPMSQETKDKISLANRGKARNAGYKHTQSWKEERSLWAKENSDIYRRNGLIGTRVMWKKNPTKIELSIKNKLDKAGINHITQFVVGDKFCVDEYLPDQNLIIEVDGKYWHKLERVVKKDKAENAYLEKCGYKVIRIPEDEVSKFSVASLISGLEADPILYKEVNHTTYYPNK